MKAQADVKAGEVATVSVKLERQGEGKPVAEKQERPHDVARAADASAKSREQVEAMPKYNGDPNRFTAAAGVVTDKLLGIDWQRGDADKNVVWQAAKDHCRSLELAGQRGWRLPTIAERVSTIDRTRPERQSIAAVFQNSASWFWSATPSHGGSAWLVLFDFGDADDYDISVVRAIRVRCVR